VIRRLYGPGKKNQIGQEAREGRVFQPNVEEERRRIEEEKKEKRKGVSVREAGRMGRKGENGRMVRVERERLGRLRNGEWRVAENLSSTDSGVP